MKKRYFFYILIPFAIGMTSQSHFLTPLWTSLGRTLLSYKLAEVLPLNVDVNQLEGGLVEGLQLKQVELKSTHSSLFDFLKVQEISTEYRLGDFFRRDFCEPIFLKSTFVHLKHLFELLKFTPHISRGSDDPLRLLWNRVLSSDLRNAMLYIKQMSFEVLPEGKGTSWRIMARTPMKGHHNQIFVTRQDDEMRFVITDFSLLQLNRIVSGFKFLEGSIEGKVVFRDKVLQSARLNLKNVKIVYPSQKEASIDLNILFRKGQWRLTHFQWIEDGVLVSANVSLKKKENSSSIDARVMCQAEDGVFHVRLKGPLENPVLKGNFKGFSDRVPSILSSFQWVLKTKKLSWERGGLSIKGLEGNLFLQNQSFPLNLKGDALVVKEGIFLQEMILMNRIRLNGFLQLLPKLIFNLKSSSVLATPSDGVNKIQPIFKWSSELFGVLKGSLLQGGGIFHFKNKKINFQTMLAHHLSSLKVWAHARKVQGLFWWKDGVEKTITGTLQWKKSIVLESTVLFKEENTHQVTGKWNVALRFQHFKLGAFVIDAQLDLVGGFKFFENKFSLAGHLSLTELKINKVSFPDGQGDFSFDSTQQELHFTNIRLGQEYLLEGYYRLGDKTLDFTWTISNADLSRLSVFFSRRAAPYLQGVMNGKISLKGAMDYPHWEGRVNFNSGQFFDVKFKEASLGLSGFGTTIDLKDSVVMTDPGQWLVSGSIDLKGKKPFKHIHFSMDPHHMGVKGFELRQDADLQELTLMKKIDKRMAIGVKARGDLEESFMDDHSPGTQFQMEYELQPQQDLLFRMDETEQMFGIRKKIKF